MKDRLLGALLIVLSGCSSIRDQVVEPVLEGGEDNADFLVHKEAALVVAYSFWDEKGVMSFVVYNNSDRPIYLDWYKSALIYQGTRLPYWQDKVSTVTHAQTRNASVSATTIDDLFGRYQTATIGIGDFASVTQVSRQERVTFIPPRAKFFVNTTHRLMHDVFSKDWRVEQIDASYASGRTEEVKVKEFNRDSSPLSFRNYMTWSFAEDFEEEFHVDDEFWVRRVVSMTNRQFKGTRQYSSTESHYIYAMPYRSPKKFFFEFSE